MGYYDTRTAPPNRSEVAPAIVAILEDMIADQVDGGGIHADPARRVKPGTVTGRDPPWSRIRVMIPETMFPDRPMPDHREIVRIQVVVEAADDPNQLSGWDYARTIAALHDAVYHALNGKSLGLDRVDVVDPIWRFGWINDAPQWAEKLRLWFQAAEFRLVLRSPIQQGG